MLRFFVIAALTACTGLALADPFRPGVEDQVKLGQRAAADIRKKQRILPDTDPRLIELRRIGNQLVKQINKVNPKAPTKFVYTFDIVEDKDLNAFALPGGPVFFNTGMLEKLTTEDQIAGIMSHELTHCFNQHWASAYADNTKRQLGITAILMIMGASQTAFDVASVADTLLYTLPYSRRHETEADVKGFDLMIKESFNPIGMVEVFQILKAGSGNRKGEEFMSTHPDTDRRIAAIQKRISASSDKFRAPVPRKVPAEFIKPLPAKTDPPKTTGGGLAMVQTFVKLISSPDALPAARIDACCANRPAI